MDDVGHGMPSSPLEITRGMTTLGEACQYLLRTIHMVKRDTKWYTIIAFGQQTRSNEVGYGMPA